MSCYQSKKEGGSKWQSEEPAEKGASSSIQTDAGRDASSSAEKTLSAIIGHVNSATTLNIYSHVTDQMRKQAAEKIDAGNGACEAREGDLSSFPSEEEKVPAPKPFEPFKGTRRKPSTGCLHQINDHLWEGKYAPRGPDGKRIHRNVYAPTKEECEEKLQALIAEMKNKAQTYK